MAKDRLATYRRKRDRDRTPEPVPAEEALPRGDDDTFVIQEHHARALHWDFRLERDGVLVSWAIPKGVPPDPRTNHLAVQTEDHPIEYATFAGEIPKGEYGGGRVTIWDRGTYETEKWSDREVKVVLSGSRVRGRYVLFRTRGKNWMIHRMDPPEEGWSPLPDRLEPMLAVDRARLPQHQERYAFEFGWDGERALGFVSGGRLRLRDAEGNDVTDRYRGQQRLGAALGDRQVLLDGELVRLDGETMYMIYDVLHLDGRPVTDLPLRRRRELLEDLRLGGPHWHVPPSYEGDGRSVREAARTEGLAAIVAKRLDSPYEPGTTSRAWQRIAV